MREDRAVFDDLDRRLAEPFETDIQVARHLTSVKGLVMASPRSLFFKIWARRDGFPLLVVEWLQPNRPDHRIVVSVPPSYSFALKGLGMALERAESEKRRTLGMERPTDQPRWADVDNSDPWYDGRSPIHAYTIVDSPHAGTVLSVAEVRSILVGGRWRATGPEAVSAL
jgi:hypothetical protein